jgi:hypothetical protein
VPHKNDKMKGNRKGNLMEIIILLGIALLIMLTMAGGK